MAKKERELPEVLEHDFIITDESVNRYGWRLLVAGIVLDGFLKNPVCCVQHNTMLIPIGKWKNLRVDGQELKGTVEFDKNDEDAVKLYWKYTDGYMNAVSLHVYPIEESEEASLIIAGQKYPTLAKSELLEISLVTLPGQKNAVKLSTPEGNEYKLNLLTKEMAKEEKTIEQLTKELSDARQLNADNLVAIHVARGVVQEGEVASLKTLALSNYDAVKQMLDARQLPEKKIEPTVGELQADALIKLHFDRGAITSEESKVYKSAAVSDYEATRKILELRPGKDGVQNFVAGMSNQGKDGKTNERDSWTYLDWYKKDPTGLSLMEKNDPDKFSLLANRFRDESKSLGIG